MNSSAGLGAGLALSSLGGAAAGLLLEGQAHAKDAVTAAGPLRLLQFDWRRDPANPILPPNPDSTYDRGACMTPRIVPRGDEYWLYYAGAGSDGKRRVCLAIAPKDRPTEFIRKGVVLDVGGKDSFDEGWVVGPRVCRIGDKWHMYYSSLPRGAWSKGLQSLTGLGLALSDDGLNWERYGDEPVVTGDKTKEFPDNRGAGGGGPPVKVVDADGTYHYRLYHTLPVGRSDIGGGPRVSQHKVSAVCHSTDGIQWYDYRIVMDRRPEVDREDYATNTPVVWHDGSVFRCLHGCIGSRWGYYSIGQAVSRDGYEWYRGTGDDNLVLGPTNEDSWESQMVAYPTVVQEGRQVRLYYCGNGYGRTGIGTAVADLAEGHNIDEGAA